MKTDVYKYEKSIDDIGAITALAEKAAAYNKLDSKQELKLSLLCEELAEMLPNLLIYGKGQFWIENNGSEYEIHALVEADDLLSGKDREEILSVSKSGKNAAAVGIMNKIKIAAEIAFANYSLSVGVGGDVVYDGPDIYSMGAFQDPLNNNGCWSLTNYRNSVKKDSDAWDELEKSIIANLADDVTVGIISGKVEIVVKKKF